VTEEGMLSELSRVMLVFERCLSQKIGIKILGIIK